jgi:hypothetical protein
MQFHDPRLKYPFSIRCDILATLPGDMDPEKKMRPYEIKTMGSSQFYNQVYEGWGGRPDKVYPGAVEVPKEYHLQQLNLYLHFMKLDYGYLFVINKDDSNYAIHKVYYDEKMYDDVVNHCLIVEKALDVYNETKVLPPRHIEPLPLSVFTRGSPQNPAGTPRLDKSSFPCMWKNKESGRWGMCNFFETCHADTLKSLGLTMESFNKAPEKPPEPEPAKELVPTVNTNETQTPPTN